MTIMQATLSAVSLKPFTKALICLSKYGDEVTISATDQDLSLSSTNSSMSAYCRFKYEKSFFTRYTVESRQSSALPCDMQKGISVIGQLFVKSLLSILKHRTVEKSVDRCELIISEGPPATEIDSMDEAQDGLESKLIVRLHCKHGVTKTHRLLLQTPASVMAPDLPDTNHESRLTIGPKAIKDMVEHFPAARGPKSDPQLIWRFCAAEVEVKTLESSLTGRGKAQLSTELTISADEFDNYDLFEAPIAIAFHLREFTATIGFAESMCLPLDLRFTDPGAPLFIDIEGDCTNGLCVISTSHLPGFPPATQQGTASKPRFAHKTTHVKRPRDGDPAEPGASKKPMKAVHREYNPTITPQTYLDPSTSMLPPTLSSHPPAQGSSRTKEPLFLPSSSQLSIINEDAIRQSGLGFENMDREELEAMLEGEGEEVAIDFASQRGVNGGSNVGTRVIHADRHQGMDVDRKDSFELVDHMGLVLMQSQSPPEPNKGFRPLFED